MKRIIFVNRFFHPDHSASSQILSDLAFHLAADGHDVHVVASRQRYDDPDARLPPEQTERGVHIHRIATTRFGRARLLGRAIDYLGFYRALRGGLRSLLRPGDVVVAKTDPPLISVVVMAAAARSGARPINWVQDLYPEVAVQLGVPGLRGPVSRVFAHWRDRSLQFAAANVVISERMAEAVAARAVPPERIHVIPNWCDDEIIVPISRHGNQLRRQWSLQDQFVVGYSGNLGRAHEFDTIVGAAAQLKAHPDLAFLFIGDGHALPALRQRLAVHGLDQSFRFERYQDREALKQSLSVPDAHWVSLKPELEGLLFPSKFYGIAAAGRPILVIGAQDGEMARLVLQHACGFVIAPGDPGALASAIVTLYRDPALCAAMGQRARAMLEDRFTRRRALQRWRDLLQSM
jgi:glycosyltransferase involved in cell wall biosynthesis